MARKRVEKTGADLPKPTEVEFGTDPLAAPDDPENAPFRECDCAAKDREIAALKARVAAMEKPAEEEEPYTLTIIEPARSTITVTCRKCGWQNVRSLPERVGFSDEAKAAVKEGGKALYHHHICGAR